MVVVVVEGFGEELIGDVVVAIVVVVVVEVVVEVVVVKVLKFMFINWEH